MGDYQIKTWGQIWEDEPSRFFFFFLNYTKIQSYIFISNFTFSELVHRNEIQYCNLFKPCAPLHVASQQTVCYGHDLIFSNTVYTEKMLRLLADEAMAAYEHQGEYFSNY